MPLYITKWRILDVCPLLIFTTVHDATVYHEKENSSRLSKYGKKSRTTLNDNKLISIMSPQDPNDINDIYFWIQTDVSSHVPKNAKNLATTTTTHTTTTAHSTDSNSIIIINCWLVESGSSGSAETPMTRNYRKADRYKRIDRRI